MAQKVEYLDQIYYLKTALKLGSFTQNVIIIQQLHKNLVINIEYDFIFLKKCTKRRQNIKFCLSI